MAAVRSSTGEVTLLRTGAFRSASGAAAQEDHHRALAKRPEAPKRLHRSMRAATTAGLLAALKERLPGLLQRLAWFGSLASRRRAFTVRPHEWVGCGEGEPPQRAWVRGHARVRPPKERSRSGWVA